ncbi:MAG: ParB/RepB/Spo0J family partition protein [Actinomyces sp.]|nr:ParB/RepB/Spo0J family partition protein [Actinomyces sp.]MCI1788172.1 ParB/RepB/Spo0J family partition protein [Actinomyces sp.]MCI1830319.1 ParB/RepB/Spo0J family partition protein [Actinomyces sp.]
MGRGLAALIPVAEDVAADEGARPLDILFPDRRGDGEDRPTTGAARRTPRGGSARDLLNPPSRPHAGGRGSGRRSRGAAESGTSSTAPHDVSRETSSRSEPPDTATDLVSVPGATFGEIPVAQIIANTRQPRQVFDEDELNELAASIAEVGVLEPVVVRPIEAGDEPTERLRRALEEKPDARYELVMGERRLRASELAGSATIPAIVRRTADEELLRDALLENLHRSNLNPLEEAAAYQQLMEDFGATQEELSRKIARSRPQIANTLRLLRLPASVQRKVAAGVLSAGHARALLAIDAPEEIEAMADRVIAEGLSVRSTEELARLRSRRPGNQVPRRRRRAATTSALGEKLAATLSDRYDTRVTVTEGASKGRIVIEFAGGEDLARLAEILLDEDR